MADAQSDFEKRWGVAPAETSASAPSATAFERKWGVAAPEVTVTAPAPAALDYTGWDIPFAPPAKVAASDSNPLSYPGMSHALAPAPHTTYGTVLPFAKDDTTGEVRWLDRSGPVPLPILPQAWRDLFQGGADLLYGPTTGTVTPAGTAALATIAGVRSPAAGTGKAIARAETVAREAPLSPEFRAAPGVTEPQFQPAAPAATSTINPLAAEQPNTAGSLGATVSPSRPAASAAPTTQEAAEYAAIPEKLPRAPIVPPLTQSAADSRADELIRHFSTRKGTGEVGDLVPGYVPTLAQKYNDPGLATLERGVQSANPGAFTLRAETNQTAMRNYLGETIGSKSELDALEAAREQSTAAMRDAAFANKTPVNPSEITTEIDKVLAGPDGKRDAVRKTLTNVKASLYDANGNLETDPEMLYGVRKHINDLLTPAAQRDNPELQQASRQLIAVKNGLDDAIEAGAPGFKQYVAEYARQSGPIDSKRYLQGLNLTDQAGNLNSGALDRAIKSVEKQQSQPGVQKASSVDEDTIDRLKRLHRTLQAQRFSTEAGKPVNSTTFQNLATNSRVGAITGNPLVSAGMAGAGAMLSSGNPLAAMAGAGLNMGAHHALANAETMTRQAILERLLNLQGRGEAAFGPPAP